MACACSTTVGSWVRPAAIVFAVAAVATVSGCMPAAPPSDPSPLLGTTLERQTAMTLDGALIDLPEPRRVTVVEIWATWCRGCTASMSSMEAIWQEDRGAGIGVVGVATDDNQGLVKEALEARGITYPNVVDSGGQVRGWLLVNELPAAAVFDPRGRMRWMREGMSENEVADVREMIRRLRDEEATR